jgi:uncharacterized protein (DUF4415 family)
MKKKNSLTESKTDWVRLKEMTDSDIDTSDVPEIDKAFFKRTKIRLPHRKDSVSLRVDHDVLVWFKEKGPGYQTRINAILRAYTEAHRREKS